jgi:uncharacterized protein YqeY
VSDLHQRLHEDLRKALAERDRAAARVLRTALSAIANAEAQPDFDETPTSLRSEGPIAGAAAGVGASDVVRRQITEKEILNILNGERDECLAIADELAIRGRQTQADALRADAAVLEKHIND